MKSPISQSPPSRLEESEASRKAAAPFGGGAKNRPQSSGGNRGDFLRYFGFVPSGLNPSPLLLLICGICGICDLPSSL